MNKRWWAPLPGLTGGGAVLSGVLPIQHTPASPLREPMSSPGQEKLAAFQKSSELGQQETR